MRRATLPPDRGQRAGGTYHCRWCMVERAVSVPGVVELAGTRLTDTTLLEGVVTASVTTQNRSRAPARETVPTEAGAAPAADRTGVPAN